MQPLNSASSAVRIFFPPATSQRYSAESRSHDNESKSARLHDMATSNPRDAVNTSNPFGNFHFAYHTFYAPCSTQENDLPTHTSTALHRIRYANRSLLLSSPQENRMWHETRSTKHTPLEFDCTEIQPIYQSFRPRE